MGRMKTDREVKALSKTPGVHRVGPGLYLRVRESGAAYWMYRYTKAGQSHEISLGPTYAKGLAEARAEAEALRLARYNGSDPALERQKRRGVPIFSALAGEYIEAHKAGWKNVKHAAQWENTLNTYAYPEIGKLLVDQIETGHVLAVLKPIWYTKAETASRLRGRIEAILDYAAAHHHRQGENPARWKGHLDKLLPRKSKVAPIEHHAALPFNEMPQFMSALREKEGIGARALEFAILTTARSGEVRGAAWPEIDLEDKVWTIPAERMKAGREHRVPLSKQALALLEALPSRDGLVFPGRDTDRPLSDMSLTAVLRRMEREDLTAHGFRSTFRDWAAELTHYPHEVAEMALAHAVGNKVEAAYRRGDLFEKRRGIMQDWADYCFAKQRRLAKRNS